MEISKSFTYVFEDKEWGSKLFFGSIISIVPILNFAIGGYLIEIIRNVAHVEQTPLPGWDRLGEKFIKGVAIWFAGLIYTAPIWLLALIFIPLALLPAISEGDAQQAFGFLLAGWGLFFGCFALLYGLAYSFIYPAVNINYALEGNFGACFQLGKIFRLIGRNIGDYLIVWAVTLLVGLVVGFGLGIVMMALNIIPCIGWLIGWIFSAFVGIWLLSVYAHLFGQVGGRSVESALEPSI